VQYEVYESKVLDVSIKSLTRSKAKFDLTIEDNHTYVVDGAIVHNSPETTAGGGKALEYYTSLRLRTKAEKRLTDKLDNVIGMGVSISNVKNKCFKPFINARNMQLLFDQGINPFGGLLELLVQTERIAPCGSGSYKVMEPYANGQEIKFKSSLERNDVPAEVLLKCPAMVDATDASHVQEYIDIFGSAMRGMAERVAGEEDVKASDEE
jgi:recombination protein RecA